MRLALFSTARRSCHQDAGAWSRRTLKLRAKCFWLPAACHALPFVTLSAVTCPKLNLQIEFGWTDKVTLERADSQRLSLSSRMFFQQSCELAPTHRERPSCTRNVVTAVYLLRSTQCQFCNCGVLYLMHVDARLALNSILGSRRVPWPRKRRRQRKRPVRRKRSRFRRHTTLAETHQDACAALPS